MAEARKKKSEKPVHVEVPAAGAVPDEKAQVLVFIGITRVAGETLVIGKDPEMERIYKFTLGEGSSGGNYCMESRNGYVACINGHKYEVNR